MTHLYLYICENGPLEKTSLSNASLEVIVNIAPIQCFIWGKFRGAKRAFNEVVRIALRLSVLVHVGNGNDGAHLPNQRTTLSPIHHSRCPQAVPGAGETEIGNKRVWTISTVLLSFKHCIEQDIQHKVSASWWCSRSCIGGPVFKTFDCNGLLGTSTPRASVGIFPLCADVHIVETSLKQNSILLSVILTSLD